MALITILLIVCALLIIYFIFKGHNLVATHCLFQFGHPSALFSGFAEGEINFKTLAKFGNFGLGTFNQIDGELVAFNGEFFRIGAQGQTTLVNSNTKTPFVQLIFFSAKEFFNLEYLENYSQLKKLIDTKLIDKNIPYALQIQGDFVSLEMRSRLQKTAENRVEEIYSINNIAGTLVGFWFPEYLLNLSVPGYHLHFISADKKISGHVMNLQLQNAQVAIEPIHEIKLKFPRTTSFQQQQIDIPSLKTYQNAQI